MRGRPRLPLDPIWVRDGRPLILYATAEPWEAEKAVEELGDALYRLDSGVVVEREAPTVITVYALVEPWRAVAELRRSPPAYVSRVLPVEAHLRPHPADAASKVLALLAERGVRGPVEMEVRVRGGCVDPAPVEEAVATAYGVRRRSGWLARVEYLCPVGVAGVVPDREDRVDMWRRSWNP